MKLNWVFGAFALFAGFVLFIIAMVFLASSQRHELVTENYYEKELQFKEVLKQKQLTKSLDTEIEITLSDQHLEIILPTPKTVTKGEVILFKPSSENDDRTITFEGDENQYAFNLTTLNRGMYKMKVVWEVGGVQYFHEQKIDL